MADVYLTQRDIDYISRVVATEVPASIARTDPEEYSRMVNAVVDTMVNRVASDSYPNTITGVANQSRQFSKITGPARLSPYGSVQAAPKASQAVQTAVAGRIADLAQGADSEIDGALSYANPNFSDASNLASWINPMIEAGAVKLGIGDSVHYHGLAPGQEPVEGITVTAEGIPSGGIPVPYGPTDDPFSLSAQAQAIDGFSGLANPVSSREAVAMTDLPGVAPFGSLFGTPNEDPAAQPAEVAAQQESVPGEWGVLNGVAPALIPTMNSWAPVAEAKPVQAPMDSVTAQGFLGAPTSLQASATAKPMMDVAATGLLGGSPDLSANAAVRGLLDNAAPADRFSDAAVQEGPFDRYVQTSSIPTEVDPNSYQPGTAPMVNTGAVLANRVQSISVTPSTAGFLNAPAINQPITQADVARAMFDPTNGAMDPSFVEGLMGPQTPVVPSAVETTSITPNTLPQEQMASVDNARFQSVADAAPKTSRIGQLPGLTDMARIDPLAGAINPATNTTGFLGQPATPADIGGFLAGTQVQRGTPTGLTSAEAMAQRGHVAYAAQKAREDAQLNSFPSLNVPATASIGGVPALDAQTTASIPSQTSSLTSNMPAYQSLAPAPGVFSAYDTPRAMAAVQQQSANDLARAIETPMFNQTAVNSIPGLANEKNPYGLDPMVALNAQPASSFDPKSLVAPADMARSIQAGFLSQPTVTASQPAAIDPTQTGGIAPNFNQAINPTMPSLMTAPVGFSDYQLAEVAQAKQIPGIFAAQPTAVDDFISAPALDDVQVADQPTIASQTATVEGPATTDATDQQETQTTAKSPTTVARTTPAVTRTQPTFVDKMKTAVNPGTALGALVGGGLLGVPGAAIGGFLGNTAYQNTGFLNQPGMTINPIGSGYENVTSIWSGSQPPGTQATASDGQTVTAMSGGRTAITGKSGVVTVFDANGKAMSYFGNDLDPNQDQDQTASTSSGGFFGGLFN